MSDLTKQFLEYREPLAPKFAAYMKAIEQQHAMEGNEEELLERSAVKVLEHAGIHARSDLHIVLSSLRGTTIDDDEADYWEHVAEATNMPE